VIGRRDRRAGVGPLDPLFVGDGENAARRADLDVSVDSDGSNLRDLLVKRRQGRDVLCDGAGLCELHGRMLPPGLSPGGRSRGQNGDRSGDNHLRHPLTE
jgi:hypothetical protein